MKDEFEYDMENASSSIVEEEEDSNNYLNNKRKREVNSIYDKMKETLTNLIRQKNKMCYEDILEELNKNFNSEDVAENLDNLLENLDTFHQDGKDYYYLK